MAGEDNPGFFSTVSPFVTLFNRLYFYFVLYRVFSYVQEDRELSWVQILNFLFVLTAACCLDYFNLFSDA